MLSNQQYAKTKKKKERKSKKSKGNKIKIRLLLDEDTSITSSVSMSGDLCILISVTSTPVLFLLSFLQVFMCLME